MGKPKPWGQFAFPSDTPFTEGASFEASRARWKLWRIDLDGKRALLSKESVEANADRMAKWLRATRRPDETQVYSVEVA